MANQRWPLPSKRAASPGRTLCSSLMAPCAVLLTNCLWPMNDAEKLMTVCARCMEPASAVVVPVRYASSVNGMGARRQNHARSAYCCIQWSSVLLRSTGRDWSRRDHRRACMYLLRHQRVEVQVEAGNGRDAATLPVTPAPVSRAERAHSRLTWAQRLARNARPETSGRVTIRLFGVPQRFATTLGWAAA